MHLSPGKRISRLVTVRPHSPFNHRYVHHVSNRWPIYFNQLTPHKSATSTVKLNPNIRPCLGPPSYRKPTTVEHPICFMIKTTIKDCQVPIESYWIYTHIYIYVYIYVYIYIYILYRLLWYNSFWPILVTEFSPQMWIKMSYVGNTHGATKHWIGLVLHGIGQTMAGWWCQTFVCMCFVRFSSVCRMMIEIDKHIL